LSQLYLSFVAPFSNPLILPLNKGNNMEKIDLRKKFKELYSSKEKPEIVEVPKFGYLTYTGRGEPGGVAYTVALNALYSVVYALKFAFKKNGRDFIVMPLEGLWWWDNPKVVNLEDAPPRETWNWTSMIMVPDFVTHEVLEELKPEIVEEGKLRQEGQAGEVQGRSLRPDPPRWDIQRRAPQPENPSWLHQGAGIQVKRDPPRDLHE